MMDIVSTKEIIKRSKFGVPKLMKKNAVSFSFAFAFDILVRTENIVSEEHKTKNQLK